MADNAQGLTLAAASAADTTGGAPPVGAQSNPPVAPHAGEQSVGTHPPAMPQKVGNPTQGMTY